MNIHRTNNHRINNVFVSMDTYWRDVILFCNNSGVADCRRDEEKRLSMNNKRFFPKLAKWLIPDILTRRVSDLTIIDHEGNRELSDIWRQLSDKDYLILVI